MPTRWSSRERRPGGLIEAAKGRAGAAENGALTCGDDDGRRRRETAVHGEVDGDGFGGFVRLLRLTKLGAVCSSGRGATRRRPASSRRPAVRLETAARGWS